MIYANIAVLGADLPQISVREACEAVRDLPLSLRKRRDFNSANLSKFKNRAEFAYLRGFWGFALQKNALLQLCKK